MKTALVIVVVLIACLLAMDCYAQDTSRFQSVGGDFGKNIISTIKANDTKPIMAAGYTDWQQGAAEGLKVGFKMGQAYEQSLNGVNITGFNAQVDAYNAWIREHFGEDPMLLMQKLGASVDLNKPVLVANNTTQKGIVHAIDGSNKMGGSKYTTNDINLMSESAIRAYQNSEAGRIAGDGYLGGV